MYSGSCLCGSVRYLLNEQITELECCHCLVCRKAHASAFSMGVTVQSRAFNLVSGAESLEKFESSPGKFRAFCRVCGSQLYAFRPANPDFLRLRPACLDTDLSVFSIKHVHCENRLRL